MVATTPACLATSPGVGSGAGWGMLILASVWEASEQNLLGLVVHLGVLRACDLGQQVPSTPRASVSPTVKGGGKSAILRGLFNLSEA